MVIKSIVTQINSCHTILKFVNVFFCLRKTEETNFYLLKQYFIDYFPILKKVEAK